LQFYYQICVRCHSTPCRRKTKLLGFSSIVDNCKPYFHCTHWVICDLWFSLL